MSEPFLQAAPGQSVRRFRERRSTPEAPSLSPKQWAKVYYALYAAYAADGKVLAAEKAVLSLSGFDPKRREELLKRLGTAFLKAKEGEARLK